MSRAIIRAGRPKHGIYKPFLVPSAVLGIIKVGDRIYVESSYPRYAGEATVRRIRTNLIHCIVNLNPTYPNTRLCFFPQEVKGIYK